MSKQNVFFELPQKKLNKTDVLFYIYKNEGKLGQMTVSRGGLNYYPSNSKSPINITWSQFDKMVKDWKDS